MIGIQKLLRNSKGMTVGDLGSLAIAFVVVTVVVSVGATVLAAISATQTADSTEQNITDAGLSGLTSIGDFLPVIGIVIAAAAVIGIILMYFAFRQ